MKKVPLTRGLFATVDDEDFDYVNQFNWQAVWSGSQFYAMRSTSPRPRKGVLLHRELLGAPATLDVHHKNGKGLDNQKENLELRTRAQNIIGFRVKGADRTSKFRGVSWREDDKKWAARISPKGKQIWLGRHSSEEEAARAYDRAARELFGELAHQNFRS